MNPAIKMLVINNAWTGYPSEFWATQLPTIMVRRELAEHFKNDPQNSRFMDHAVIADNLKTAMEFAFRQAKTDKIIIFDGAAGGINVSEPLAELLVEKAGEVSDRVDKKLIPKWMAQRGIKV